MNSVVKNIPNSASEEQAANVQVDAIIIGDGLAGISAAYIGSVLVENEIVHIIYLTTTSPLLSTAYCQYRIECTKPM